MTQTIVQLADVTSGEIFDAQLQFSWMGLLVSSASADCESES